MEVSKEENEARLNLLECLDDNVDDHLYLSSIEKNRQGQQKTNYEIESWGNEGSINILSSLGEYNSRQKVDNNSSTRSSKTQIESKTQLSSRFLQNNRRQQPGQSSNLQTVYSSLTNNSNQSKLFNMNSQSEEKNQVRNVSIHSNIELQSSLLQTSIVSHQGQNESSRLEDDGQIASTNDQIKFNDMQSSEVFMSPNYVEHRKQLQVGMLIDRHHQKNGKTIQFQKTNESSTFNDKQFVQDSNNDITSLSVIMGGSGGGGGQQKKSNQQNTIDNKEVKYRVIQSKQLSLSSPKNAYKKQDQKKGDGNGQHDIFRCLNYYDVDLQGQENQDTLRIKNDIKKYKKLRPGTYVVCKKDSQKATNNYNNCNGLLNNTLDLNNLKLLQNTTSSAPFQMQRTWKKNHASLSEERPFTERSKEKDINNIFKTEFVSKNNNQALQNVGLNIEQIRIPRQLSSSHDKFYSQTSRNSLSLNEGTDFSEKFREQASMQTPNAYSPLKQKFKFYGNQQIPMPQKRNNIRGGGGFYYEKEDNFDNKQHQRDLQAERDEINIFQQYSQDEYSVQTHSVQQFIEQERVKEIIQLEKMQKKEYEANLIQYDLNQREINHSPTQVVAKYTKLMREDLNLKKNVYFVNKKLNRLERKRTIEEFKIRSSSPIAQILEAVNQNPLFKQTNTFFHIQGQKQQSLTQSQITSTQTSPINKKSQNKGLPEIIPLANDTNNTSLGSSQYTKYRKWKGSPLFNLENNDLNRNPYINSGYSPLLTQNQFSTSLKSKDKSKSNHNQLQTLYNPHPHILKDQTKKYKQAPISLSIN